MSRLTASIEKESQEPASRFVTLATVTADQEPRARTVVFRGFLDGVEDSGGATLKFVTDKRSEKIGEIASNPKCEVMWYFRDTREQYRLKGVLEAVSDGESDEFRKQARALQWTKMSQGARQSFEWPNPGIIRPPYASDEADFMEPTASKEPSPNFVLLLMVPESVDYLNLRERPQLREKHSKTPEGAWSATRVNP